MLNVILLSVVMVNVVLLSVGMVNVAAPNIKKAAGGKSLRP
jgi:hypothetical protein